MKHILVHVENINSELDIVVYQHKMLIVVDRVCVDTLHIVFQLGLVSLIHLMLVVNNKVCVDISDIDF